MIAIAVAVALLMQQSPSPRYFCVAGPGISFQHEGEISRANQAILDVLAAEILSLDPRPRIQIFGFANKNAPRREELRIALQRAVRLRAQLVRRGVPTELLFIAVSEREAGAKDFVGIGEIVSPAEIARRAADEAELIQSGRRSQVC